MAEGAPSLGLGRTAVAFARLKWHLLRGGLRGNFQQRIQTVLSAVVAVLLGLLAAVILIPLGRRFGDADLLVVVMLPVTVLALGLLSAATGIEATIDPRHLAGEPLTHNELGLGMLAAAAIGPASFLAVLTGVGIAGGWGGGGVVGWLLTGGAVVGWWLTLLLFSRTTANLLGAVASGRFRQIAQVAASSAALLTWLIVQVLARQTSGWDHERWESLADVARWTPPGQLGEVLANLERPAAAVGHLVLGLSWLPLLALASVWSTIRLAFSPPRAGAVSTRSTPRPAGLRTGVRTLLPRTAPGAIAVRTLATKLRTPRQSVNTLTALLVGGGVIVIGPLLDGGDPDPRIVLVGGLLHFAVLFDGNNVYGMDGPGLWIEVASGADASVLTRGKILSSLVVMALPALVLPVALAALAGGWAWLPAAWLIAAGSLFAAAGVSIASASLAPVALPDSPNPLASGDAGQGCVAGLMLAVGMLVLGVVSLPVGVAVVLASSRSVALTTAAAAGAPLLGALVLWGCAALARGRIRHREAELVQNVTPAR